MSTRSGKRLHNSVLEVAAPTEQESAVKSERKTRSKRVKDDSDELSVSLFKNKKRNNYVSYPTDDELLGEAAIKKDEDNKLNRALRKNALKEQNTVDNNAKLLEPQDDAKNLIRKSRRGKKLDEENENYDNVQTEVTELPKSKKTKRKKKIIAEIDIPVPAEEPAKKSKKKKKKGKKTSSIVIEDIQQNDNTKISLLNKSNMSIDSFHSAAGSPGIKHQSIIGDYIKDDTIETTEFPETNSSKRIKKYSCANGIKTNDGSTSKNTSLHVVDEEKNNSANNHSKKNKIVSKDSTVDKVCYVSVTNDDLEKDLENIINASNLSNSQLKKRKSYRREATFDKCTVTVDLENIGNPLNFSNVSNKGKRRSNINYVHQSESMSVGVDDSKNQSFDKVSKKRNSIIKDATYESTTKEVQEEDSEIDSNISNISGKQLKARSSFIKDTTFNKSNASVENVFGEININGSYITLNKGPHTRKSIVNNTTFEKSNTSIISENYNGKETDIDLNLSTVSNKQHRRRRSNVKDTTFEKPEKNVITTFEKTTDSIKKGHSNEKDLTFNKSNCNNMDVTYEKYVESDATEISTAKGKETTSSGNTTYDKTDKAKDITFEKDISTSFNAFKKGAMTRKSSIQDNSFDKSTMSLTNLTKEDFEKDNNIISSSIIKRRSSRRHTFDKTNSISENVNTTFEKPASTDNELKRKSPRASQSSSVIQNQLNTTFEKETIDNAKDNLNSESVSFLISADHSGVDKSDISRISITSDDTAENVENIVNTTPVLIESSMDESHILATKPGSPKPQTPLKREGTFTKDGPEVQTEDKVETPTKQKSLPVPSAGCTPYHITKSSQKKTMLNVTRSLEKGICGSIDQPKMTRVMFCSPVDNPVIMTQEKRKIIKSNLKGSNKSFVYDESASIPRPARKRSYTQSDADDARVKRTRLTEDLQQSVDRLSRPRTASATGKLLVTTPSKKPPTPSKPKSDGKPSRTKLPNFAALHQKQFEKMESLDECQERRAKRAKQLLTPTAPPGLLDRISPKNNADSPKTKEVSKPKEKTDTPTKKLPTLESLRPGFTRFGFKLNLDVNPFSIPSKTEKPKEKPVEKPNGLLPKPAILPSLAGATSVRREVAKQAVMREKSFTDRRNVKRTENRTIIKGVRTNRRFELQMKLRNIE